VKTVCYNITDIYVRANGLASYTMGPWEMNPNVPASQDYTFKITRIPAEEPGTKTGTPFGGPHAIAINGVVMYGYGDGKSYSFTQGENVNNGDGNWVGDAWISEGSTMDASGRGHADMGGNYHYHATPITLYTDPSTGHSAIIGYALDGYPIYGPFGYTDATNSSSGVTRMVSSYQLRNITDRTILPDGSTSTPSGPTVSATFPLGTYIQDYEYVASSGTLDEYNGRDCVTPEYPGGTYAYFLTTDNSGDPQFPYILAGSYYGVLSQSDLNSAGSSTSPAGLTCYTGITTLSTETDITSFSFPEQTGAATIDATNHTIDIEVVFGTDVTALVSTFTLSAGATAKVGTTAQVSGTTANDFTNAVTYTITAEDGTTTQDWAVTVSVAATLNTEPDILTFSFAEQTNPATIDNINHTIAIEVTSETVVTALISTFTLSAGAIAKVGTTAQVSGTTANDFTNAVTYTVTAEDGTSFQDWTVTVTNAPNTETDITAFSFAEQTEPAIIDVTSNSVNIEVETGTDMTNLVPTITLSEGATVSPNNGVAQDFTNAVTYTVTAEDGTTMQDWVVTVTELPLGLEEFEIQDQIQLQSYPNPVVNSFSLTDYELKIHELLIYDLNGRLVEHFTRSQYEYNVWNLPNGIYILVLKSADQVYFQKMIKN